MSANPSNVQHMESESLGSQLDGSFPFELFKDPNEPNYAKYTAMAAGIAAVACTATAYQACTSPSPAPAYQGNKGGMAIASDVLDLVGNTPMVYLNNVTKGCHAKVVAKLESNNPVNSVKDRLAVSMIQEAEKQGLIRPGKSVLVEATSGNTGIALACFAGMKGYKVILTMPESMSMERRCLLKVFGAEIVLTPAAKGMKGAIAKADEIVKKTKGAMLTEQFKTLANAKVHRNTTGPEIYRDTKGKVDMIVAGVGTGGTITGIAQYLKATGSHAKIVAVEPAESPVLSGGKPGPHKIQGIGAGFIPQVMDPSLMHQTVQVSSEQAMQMAKRLPREEGLFTGISAGAAVHAAVQLAKNPENKGKLIAVIIPSFGERYLSSPMFADLRKEAENLKVHDVQC